MHAGFWVSYYKSIFSIKYYKLYSCVNKYIVVVVVVVVVIVSVTSFLTETESWHRFPQFDYNNKNYIYLMQSSLEYIFSNYIFHFL